MSTIAVVTVDAGGNVPPAMRIAEELSARGHRIGVIGQPRQEDLARSRGFDFRPLDAASFWDAGRRRSVPAALGHSVRLLSDARLGAEAARLTVELGAEVAIVDCMMASCSVAIRRAGRADAVLFHTLLDFWSGSFARGPVGLLARARGFDARRAWSGAAARLVTTDRALEPDGRGADWIGSVERGIPAGPDAGRPPLVLVSLSTTWFPGQTAVYQRILDALAPLPIRVIVTLGGLAPDRPLRPAANTTVLDRADHAVLLPQASLVIGHGGHSTTLRALAHGIPLVMLPMHPLLDQPAVAAAVQRLGTGVALRKSSSPERIREAVQRTLGDGEVTRGARRFGAHLRETDAAAAAADRIEELAVGTRA